MLLDSHMLLDTHVLLWLLDDDPCLGPVARSRLTAGGEVFVSAVSFWELAIKVGLGKVSVPDDLPARVEAAGLSLLPVTTLHSWRSRVSIGLPHRDPFDRLLVHQALAEHLSFVTADALVLGADLDPAPELVDART